MLIAFNDLKTALCLCLTRLSMKHKRIKHLKKKTSREFDLSCCSYTEDLIYFMQP